MMFVPPNYKNKKVALLGLGLTGGSLIKHLKSREITKEDLDKMVYYVSEFYGN